MSQRSEYLRKVSALSLILLWLITSCVNQNFQSQPDPVQSATATLPEGNPFINIGTPYPFEGTPYPMGYVSVTNTPNNGTITPTFTLVPYLPPPTPAATLSQSHCYEETVNFYNHGATATPTPPGWYYQQLTTLTNGEVGNAGTEEIVKLLLGKFFDQFKTPQADQWKLEDYAIESITITTKIECYGPTELENYWGHLKYEVKPASDVGQPWWYAGGAHPIGFGWIENGTDFKLIKTKSGYELILTGNG